MRRWNMKVRVSRKNQKAKAAGLTGLLVFAVFLFICGPAAAEDLFPLYVGKWQEFAMSDSALPPNEWTKTAEVLGQESAGAETFFRIGLWGEEPGSYSEFLIRSTDTAAYIYNGTEGVLVWQAAPVGTSWDYADMDGDGYPGRTYTEITSIEPVTVPYGTFQNAYVHRSHFVYDSDGTVSPYWYEYIVPGVGMVKMEDYWVDANPPVIQELSKVGGKSFIGIYRDGTWFLDLNGNGQWDGQPTDWKFRFGGVAGDIPVTGDWDGTGTAKAGIYRDGTWFLDLNGNGHWDGQPTDSKFRFGGVAGDIPVTGDWDGTGSAKAGIYRDGTWFLDLSGNGHWDGQPTDSKFRFGGVAGDIPIIGDWDGTGTAKAGIYRDGTWFLDLSGNGHWDGQPTDSKVRFGGVAGDLPLGGTW
jgi:hypothetical protein